MYYVYIIQSLAVSNKVYVGYTLDVESRISVHNSGGSIHTAKYKPWELVWHCSFNDKIKAAEFEKYLKSHSDRAFMSKRLVR